MKKIYSLSALLIFTLVFNNIFVAQCDPSVPIYQVDLSSNPDSTWTLLEANADDREGQCCTALDNENCIQFEITLSEQSAGIFFDYDGAPAFGSLGWQMDCGPIHNLRDTICVSDPGPFTITFCKPGSDNGNYFVRSVPEPIFSPDQAVPLGCIRPLETLGVTLGSIAWNSIAPGAPGDYNYTLSCTDCLDPIFTPDASVQPYVDFAVQGYPELDYCVGQIMFYDTVRITVLDSIKIGIDNPVATFCSGGSATINAFGFGGDGNYSFHWFNSNQDEVFVGPSFTTDEPGTYTVEVREGSYNATLCPGASLSFSVSESFPPEVDAGMDQVLCATSPDAVLLGDIQFASGGIWSGGNGVFTPSNTDLYTTYSPTNAEIENGSVSLTLTSTGAGGGCTNNADNVTLFFSDTMSTDLANLNANCSDSELAVNPIISGGMEPFTYLWNDGSTSLSNNLGIGKHCLTITDVIGCQYTECLNISAPNQLNLVTSSTDVTADGLSDGTATASPSGGTAPYSYSWSNSGNNQTETGLSYGVYMVTVTDDNGCAIDGSVVVNEPRCLGFDASTSTQEVLCYGGSDGSATVSISGGTAPFSYSWDDAANQSGATASDLSSGVYTVLVSDANGCETFATAVILENPILTNSMLHTDLTLQGGNDGSASANVGGGTAPYSYSWSNSESSSNISNLSTGTYSVLITDANNCTLMDSVFVSEPPCNGFSAATSATNPLCFGDSNGSALLTIHDGEGPYSVNWSNGAADVMSISGLASGQYSVEITDTRNCYTFVSFAINDPSPLSVGLASTSISCNQAGDGTIDLSASGGTFPPYTFAWSNGALTEDIINLDNGIYSVVVTDLNGCTASSSSTISEPSAVTTSYSTVDVTCFGGSDGSIDLNVAGGSLPYVYSWSNGETTQDLSNLDVGGYILDLTDGNYCSPADAINITINEPAPVVIDAVDIDCPAQGGSEVNVTVSVSGGNPDYQISFNDGNSYGPIGEYSAMLKNESNYSIMAMDVNGCVALESFDISIDPNVAMEDYSVNLCYAVGQETETVFVTPSGGNGGPYEVSFNNGISYEPIGDYDIDVAINNSYDIIIRDGKGCISKTYQITLPDTFDAAIAISSDYNGEDVSCFGSADGEAIVSASGGRSPYIYSWSNGQSSQSATGLAAGNYSVLVTDAHGCSVGANVVISQPNALNSSIAITSNYNGEDVSCFGSEDGSASASASGGVAPYFYTWNGGQNSANINGLSAGSYDVEVMDANGCLSNSSATISDPAALTSSTEVTVELNGENIACFGAADGEALTTANGGVEPYSYLWSDGQITAQGINLSGGTYDIIVTDANGCTNLSSVTLTDPLQLIASAVVSSDYNGEDVSCFNDVNGQATASATGGTGAYHYLWSDGQTTAIASGLSAGTYTVVVKDDNGCPGEASVTINNPAVLSTTIAVTSNFNGQDISCFDANNGEAEVVPSGGTMPYTYSWSNGQTTSNANELGAGVTAVIITDVNGCSISVSTTLTQPDRFTSVTSVVSEFHGEDISCFGGSNGIANVELAGGTLPYSYLWSNGQTSNTALGLTAGIYSVVATDVNGCSSSNSISLSQPEQIEIPSQIRDVTCNGGNDGAINISPFGGIEPYAFQWSNGETVEDISKLVAGLYEVLLTDANGCEFIVDNLVVAPTAIDLSIEISTVLCKGQHNGSIDLSASGGTPPYHFEWSNDMTTEDISNLSADTYNCLVTDYQGCYTEISGIISEPDSIDFDYDVTNVKCHGEDNGSLTVYPYGGTPPYTYSWANGKADGSWMNLSSGLYNLSVSDANGCAISGSIFVNEPEPLFATISSAEYFHGHNVSLHGGHDGSIDLDVDGGTQPYYFDWSVGSNLQDLNNVYAGNYSVLIIDANDCEYETSIELTEPLDLIMPTGFSPNQDGRNDFYEIKGIEAYPNNELVIFNRWGNIVFTKTNYNNTWNGVSDNGSDLPEGTYFVILNINNGEIELNNYVDLRH